MIENDSNSHINYFVDLTLEKSVNIIKFLKYMIILYLVFWKMSMPPIGEEKEIEIPLKKIKWIQ